MKKKVAKKSIPTKKFPTKATKMVIPNQVAREPQQQGMPQGRPDTPLAATPEPQQLM